MKRSQLIAAGVPDHCMEEAIDCIKEAARLKRDVHASVPVVVSDPNSFAEHEVWGPLARALIEAENIVERAPIQFRQWGTDIDDKALQQMVTACKLPIARKAAVMPDAHLGYGVPIGCVLATENAVIPNAVGVDIGCRMKLSIFYADSSLLDDRRQDFREAIREETRFGLGCEFEKPRYHAVMDDPAWKEVTQGVNSLKDTAHRQLGTSGGGNHFVEFGIVRVHGHEYLALMTHSGSRGMGSKIATKYHRLARKLLPNRYRQFRELAWLSLDTQAGQEYWLAMNLAGRYAQANHDCIHAAIGNRLGLDVMAVVENHHNFAWKEYHDGRLLIVHRKGATPAGLGVRGVIPGDMVEPAFLVQGKGVAASLNSASHGAGRAMSRTQAKQTIDEKAALAMIAERGIELMSAGHDELPGVYKNIHEVMRAQEDLVEVIGEFYPRLVCMAGDRR